MLGLQTKNKINMKTKKAYKEILALLEANKTKKIGEILPKVIELCKTPEGGKKGVKWIADENNKVVAIKCHYFRKWFALIGNKATFFGENKNNKTGYCSTSKIGLASYNKKQLDFQASKILLLEKLSSGNIKLLERDNILAKLELDKQKIEATSEGFSTLAELLRYLGEQNITINIADYIL